MKNVVETLLRHVQQGHLDKLKLFITDNYPDTENGNPNLEWASVYHNKSGDTVQIVASRNGHLHILKWLKALHIDLRQSNFGGKDPLHEAAQHSHVECVRYLLEQGANVDCIKQADWTPVMLACTKTHLEVVQVLVEHGAQLGLQNKDGWTCFQVAVREGDERIVSYLLDKDPGLWNTVSKNGRTPLHTAALHGKLDTTEILLRRGKYPVDGKDSCGSTPLMDAILNSHKAVAEKIIKDHGAKLDAVNDMGRQAIHQAAQTGNVDAILYLVQEHSIDVNVRSCGASHVAPLHMAAKERQQEAIRVLLELGADTDCVDSRGRTALHIAAGVQDENCVKMLLDHGATDCHDQSGKLAKDLLFSSRVKELFSDQKSGCS